MERARQETYIRSFATRPEVRRMEQFVQHGNTSCLLHCVAVAHVSFAIARALHLRVREEALSRGAADCVFVDESREAVGIVKENLAKCRFTAKVVQGDSLGYLRGAGKFDIIFLDPPYDSDMLDKSLEIIQNVDILTEGGIIVCESRREKSLPEPRAPYVRALERSYGKVRISVYKRESSV